MKKWLADLFGDESSRADEMALLTVLSVLSFLALSFVAYVVHRQTWAPVDFGVGLGSVLGTAAVGMGIKKRLGA